MSGTPKPTRLIAMGVLSAALVGLAATLFIRTQAQPEPPLIMQAEDAAEVDVSSIREMAIGAQDAPVTVIEYASFTCPHCASFHASVFPELRANYVETGQVRFVVREVYFDRYGLWASMLARCGGGNRFFGLADMIYDQQAEWTQGTPADIAENLRRMGRTAGLGQETLTECLSDAGKAETLVAWYTRNAEADDINSTPSFIIDGQKYSNMGYADFAAVLDEKLAD